MPSRSTLFQRDISTKESEIKKDETPKKKPRKKSPKKATTARKRENMEELPHAFGTCVPMGECQCQK